MGMGGWITLFLTKHGSPRSTSEEVLHYVARLDEDFGTEVAYLLEPETGLGSVAA